MIYLYGGYERVTYVLRQQLLDAPEIDVGTVHAQDIKGKDHLITKEIRDISFDMKIPEHLDELQLVVEPHLPWAEDHFQERVSGEPLNPPPSAAHWPFAQRGNAEYVDENGKFSHSYPERFWPKYANFERAGEQGDWVAPGPIHGVRFDYGDLEDVVNLLHRQPLTRQAYLPVWFPEDTGARQRQRVPCSLGYHFCIRDNAVNITYYTRSCDFMRYFKDDVYMAARLCQWVRDQLVERGSGPEDLPVPQGLAVGKLTMHTVSMHIFKGDVPILEQKGLSI